ncbi:hypothetical protein DH2020_013392 [Rehmannia glutinosa]|uniref:BED-type domain-containing protein n=1 Tax=Rehmannia glutinosa TaxID=99300 RepID=A0ABR0X3A9_REHGL
MDLSVSQTAYPVSDGQPNKRRRKKSMVWDHFTIEKVNPDCIRASCNQCKKSFAYVSGSKLAGTSHLKRHIALGICPVGRHKKEKNQLSPYTPAPRTNISANGSNLQRKRYRAANGVASIEFNGNNFSHELAKLIIQQDYPLHMVEHTGFIDFARSLQPQINTTSISTVQEQIMGIYMREKQKLMDLLSGIPGRANLTLDLWTSSQSLVYALLTGHFIDHDWKLQRRVFNFFIVQFPDSDTALNSVIASCLNDWSLEDKLFTLTLDCTCANQNARENLRNLQSIKNSFILKGQLLINSCYARTLSSLAIDAIASMRETIEKVRHSVKYIKTSDAHEEKFTKLKQLLQVPSTKTLMIDDLSKWNTTYQMLTAASELKQVFSCLDTSDPDYKSTLSMEEWRQVEALCAYLKIIYEAANKLTSPVYPTANLFFREASDIHLELMHAATSQDSFVSTLIKPLHEKFAKYWEDSYLMLAIAAVVDPRFKLELVESKFSCIYGKDAKSWTTIVRENLHQLFVEYETQYIHAPIHTEEGNENLVKTEVPQGDILLTEGDDLLYLDIDFSDFIGTKSELDEEYSEDPVFHQPHINSYSSSLKSHGVIVGNLSWGGSTTFPFYGCPMNMP